VADSPRRSHVNLSRLTSTGRRNPNPPEIPQSLTPKQHERKRTQTDLRKTRDDAKPVHWELTREAFERWWTLVLMPEDSSEYVRLYGGTLDGARFVCALDYLTNVSQRTFTDDLVTRAYLIAIGQPDAPDTAKSNFEARALLEDDAVQALLDRVRYHTERRSAERLARRASRKIEELFDRAEDPQTALNYEQQLATERTAVAASLQFRRQVDIKEARIETARMKRAVADAQNRSSAPDPSGEHALPSPGEAKQFLAMLRDRYGPDTFAEIMQSVTPPALPEEASPANETFVDVG
jgi:hypothetical protein